MKHVLLLILLLGLLAACRNDKTVRHTISEKAETSDNNIQLSIESDDAGYSDDEEGSELLDKVLANLQIDKEMVETYLCAEKVLPYDTDFSVMAIPVIPKDDEYSYDGYVLVVENETGTIRNKYYQPNLWTNDAFRLDNITIDTAPYRLNSDVRAFGLRLSRQNNSRISPASVQDITLYIPKGDTLVDVLNNFTISQYNGSWDGNCEGSFTDTEGIILLDKETTNGFCNLRIKFTDLITTNYVDESGECDYTEKTEYRTQVLQFIDGKYQ